MKRERSQEKLSQKVIRNVRLKLAFVFSFFKRISFSFNLELVKPKVFKLYRNKTAESVKDK